MKVVSCLADLQYVNKKLVMSDSKVWMRRQSISKGEGLKGIPVQSSSSRTIPSHIKNRDLAVTSSGIASDSDLDRQFVSPDSNIPCDDPECPIKMPHNVGRFYINGNRADSPVEIDYQTSSRGLMIPTSHYFNYTVPPPEIVEAYLKVAEGQASTEERDMVRSYKMKHCFSPIISEVPSPDLRSPNVEIVSIPCLVFDPEMYDAKRQEWLYGMLEKDVNKEVDNLMKMSEPVQNLQETQSRHDASHRLSKCCNGNCPPIPPRRCRARLQKASTIHTSAPEQKQSVLANKNGAMRGTQRQPERKSIRYVPKGENLRETQLTLKEQIINQIAERAVQESKGNSLAGSPSLSISSRHTTLAESASVSATNGGSDETCVAAEDSEDIDRRLELHAALTKKLKTHLQDSTFQSISLLDKNDAEVDAKTKFEYMSNVLLIVRHALRQLLGDFTRPYRPSGTKVANDELEDLFEEHLQTYEMLQEEYPHMMPTDIILCLDKIGRRARLENPY